ncbi:MAG: hypothetical protein ACJ762_20510 [Solirubrobacteraceae bacterium]
MRTLIRLTDGRELEVDRECHDLLDDVTRALRGESVEYRGRVIAVGHIVVEVGGREELLSVSQIYSLVDDDGKDETVQLEVPPLDRSRPIYYGRM